MAKAVVLFDSYRYHEKTGDLSSQVLEAGKGEEIEVSDDEFKRGTGMDPPGLAKAGSKDAKEAASAPADNQPQG